MSSRNGPWEGLVLAQRTLGRPALNRRLGTRQEALSLRFACYFLVLYYTFLELGSIVPWRGSEFRIVVVYYNYSIFSNKTRPSINRPSFGGII